MVKTLKLKVLNDEESEGFSFVNINYPNTRICREGVWLQFFSVDYYKAYKYPCEEFIMKCETSAAKCMSFIIANIDVLEEFDIRKFQKDYIPQASSKYEENKQFVRERLVFFSDDDDAKIEWLKNKGKL